MKYDGEKRKLKFPLIYVFQKAKATHGSLFSKGTSSEQSGKHVRAVSASRYAQSTQKAVLSKSQSVEEIRKKAQVNDIHF